jgi:hypothetical protein
MNEVDDFMYEEKIKYIDKSKIKKIKIFQNTEKLREKKIYITI